MVYKGRARGLHSSHGSSPYFSKSLVLAPRPRGLPKWHAHCSMYQRLARLLCLGLGDEAGELRLGGVEIMAQVNRSTARRVLGFLVLIALVAGSVIPASAQRRRTRRNVRLGRYSRQVK